MDNNLHSKIAIVIGTKAELIKCIPIMLELQKRNLNYTFISTGQHNLTKLSNELNVKNPDFILSKEPENTTKFWSRVNNNSFFWNILMVFKIKKLLRKIKPKYVIYHGDTMSSADAAIGSSRILNPFKKWKNVHLEAGLRSGSLSEPFPEEISRQICDKFSDTLFAVSDLTEKNLKNQFKNSKKEVIKTGNTVIDSAWIIYENAKKKFKKQKQGYVLINLHRHENLINKNRMIKIVEILKKTKIKGIWPLHENTKVFLEKYGLMSQVSNMKNIEITPLKDYEEFIFLLGNCKYLITDGGSIQEESLVFKKPCILLRNLTERQEGLNSGINFLTKLNVEEAGLIIRDIEKNKIKIKNFKNPYGEKGLSKQIVNYLLERN